MKHSEIDVRFLWNLLSDFWNHFEDKETVSQVWRTFLQAMSNIYYQLYQVGLSKSIETIPYQWITDWEPVALDKTSYISSNDSIIFYKEGLPVTLKDIDWDDASLIYTKRNPSGVLKYDDNISGWYVTDVDNNRHYRDFPVEYLLPSGLKSVTYLVETPRNGVKFSHRAYSPEGDIITYDNGHIRPFETKHLTDKHGFGTEYVSNGVLMSGEPGNQDFIILSSGEPVTSRICLKTLINTTMWTHVGIRQSYNLYESFGYLLRFFKPDTLTYLRELQGLWLSYLSSPTISALKRGLTILRSLPFALKSGVITSVVQNPSTLLINHVNPVYRLLPNENPVQYDPRNDVYNPYDYSILTDHTIYETSGSIREPEPSDYELDAKPFTVNALTTGDYVYALDRTSLTVTFSYKRIEHVVRFPDSVMSSCHDTHVLSAFVLDDRYCIRLSDRIISTYIPFEFPPEGTELVVDEDGRISGTPMMSELLGPVRKGDMITNVVSDGSESYLEINRNVRFLITENEADYLISENIIYYILLYINGKDVTIGSTAAIQLDQNTFDQMFVGDYISFISPYSLIIDIDGDRYEYDIDCEVAVISGQYISKYDPLVNGIQVKDYLTDPSWIIDGFGFDPDEFYNNNDADDNLFKNEKRLNALLNMWHTFYVEVDEKSAPSDFETANLMHTFVKEAKPTYVDHRMVVRVNIEDSMVMSDRLITSSDYQFNEEYPWAGIGLLIFDGGYKFDDDQHFNDSDLVDPVMVGIFKSPQEFEEKMYTSECYDNGRDFNDGLCYNDYEFTEGFSTFSYTPSDPDDEYYYGYQCMDEGMVFDSGHVFNGNSTDTFNLEVIRD